MPINNVGKISRWGLNLIGIFFVMNGRRGRRFSGRRCVEGMRATDGRPYGGGVFRGDGWSRGQCCGRRVVALTKREQAYVAGVVMKRFPCGGEQRISASQQKSPKRFWRGGWGECLFLKKALPRKKITRVFPHPPCLPVKNNFVFCASSKNALKFFGEGCGEPPWFTKGVPRMIKTSPVTFSGGG